MNRSSWICSGLVCSILFASSGVASARSGYGAFRNYMQQQQKANQQMLQVQQKAMMEAMARQAAIEKQKRDNIAKAHKARSEKEEQHRQDLISKRKAESAAKGSAPRDKTPPK